MGRGAAYPDQFSGIPAQAQGFLDHASWGGVEGVSGATLGRQNGSSPDEGAQATASGRLLLLHLLQLLVEPFFALKCNE